MASEMRVIYEARTMPEALRLKERLLEAGIPAVIGSEVAEGESTSDVWGLPEPTRVAVEEAMAEAARQIAIQFDAEVVRRVGQEAARRRPSDEEEVEGRDESGSFPGDEGLVPAGPVQWPRCPACGAPRLTQCPACQTTGTEFRRAELPEAAEDAGTARELVICPDCDEPFPPQYTRQCHQCGHQFADGFELHVQGEPAPEWVTWRIVLAIVVFAVIIAGLVIYFASLV